MALDMAKSRTFVKRTYTTFTFDLHDLLKVTAHLSSQNNLLMSYETDWTKGGSILSSQIFYTFVCWGVYLRPSNLGQCNMCLLSKQPISVYFLDSTHRSSVALHLSVSLFKIILTIIFDCLLIVCVEKLNSFSPAINLRVQSGLPYLTTGTSQVATHPMKHSGHRR